MRFGQVHYGWRVVGNMWVTGSTKECTGQGGQSGQMVPFIKESVTVNTST